PPRRLSEETCRYGPWGADITHVFAMTQPGACGGPCAHYALAAMFDLPTPKPLPANEPVLSYAPGSPERAALKDALKQMARERPDAPHVVGGKELRDGPSFEVKAPLVFSLVVAT